MPVKYEIFTKNGIKEVSKREWEKASGLDELKKRHDSKETRKEVKEMCEKFLKKEITPKEFIEWAEKIWDSLDLKDQTIIWNTKTFVMLYYGFSCNTEVWKEIDSWDKAKKYDWSYKGD